MTTGAGLGGIRLLLGTKIERCLDLTTGFFPVLEALSNPHFVAGTALLVWALLAHAATAGARSFVAAAALGTALGLTRPYDLLVLVAVRTVVVAIAEPARAWWRHGAAMAALVPVAAYNYWVFYRQPAFTFYTEAAYVFPTRADLAWALGPAAALAVAALGARSLATFRQGPGAVARLHFAAWCAIAVVVFVLRPVHFSLQFLVGVGLPLLALAAIGLGRRAGALHHRRRARAVEHHGGRGVADPPAHARRLRARGKVRAGLGSLRATAAPAIGSWPPPTSGCGRAGSPRARP